MKLSDTQRNLLQAAAKHPQKLLADFPANLKGGALIKVLTALGNQASRADRIAHATGRCHVVSDGRGHSMASAYRQGSHGGRTQEKAGP